MRKRLFSVFIVLMVLLSGPLSSKAGAESRNQVYLKTKEMTFNYKTGKEISVIYEYELDANGRILYCCSSMEGDQGTSFQYYPNGTLKQKNGTIEEAFPDYFMAGYPYEIHYDKYGTQIEWYENYYVGATQTAHEPGIPCWSDYPVKREYNQDGQIRTFRAKGPVTVYWWEPGYELSVRDVVDVKASYQYDTLGRILSYRIERSAGDYSNEGFFRYYDDGSYTEFLRVFRDLDSIHSWFYLDFDADKMMTRYEAHEYMSAYGFEYEDITVREFTYDAQGRILEQQLVRNGQKEGGERYKYTDSDRQTVIEYTSDWQSPSSRDREYVIRYDEEGNETEWFEYDKNSGDLIRSRTTEYMKAENLH